MRSRWTKGTTDHDGDGLMGGSRKGDATMAKATTKRATANAPAKTATKTPDQETGTAAKKQAARDTFAEADAKGAPTLDEIQVGLAVRGY